MKKKIFGLLSLIIVASLSGCADNSQDEDIPDSIGVIQTESDISITEPEVTSSDTSASLSETTLGITTVDPAQSEKEAEESRLKAEEEERLRREEEERLKREEEERRKQEEEERRQAEEEARKKAEEEARIEKERNSFSMMYHLAITAEEIRISKDNRVVLEEIYTSLLNDINPGAVDETTQEHLQNLRDIIKSYLNISTKRERLQFIYNQQKASAIRSAIPNPIAILSVNNAMDWKRLAVSVAYTAADSYSNYKNAGENADTAFIMSGWELDDEEIATIQKNRDRAFDYMVDMVRANNLDGLKTLNEKAIENFAEISSIENPSEKIKRLVAEESTYNLLGNYWLELADSYFETSQYTKCLECVDKYNELSTKIYRQDYNYLEILPKAIVAAQNEYTGKEYISKASEFADSIISNSTTDDWSNRYFASQVYLDLYSKTNDKTYLKRAYKIVSENVAVLLNEQRELNEAYINPVAELTVEEPDYRYMSDNEKKEKKKEYNEEKKRVKEYNRALKEKRKTELPSLYQPLVVNCELMFALADKMELSQSEKNEIEDILATATNGTFIVKPINDMYSFGNKDNTYSFEFTKDEMIIPVNLLTSEAKITVTVDENGTKNTYDCSVVKVERKGDTIDTYYAHVSNKELKKYKWSVDSKVTVDITYGDAYDKSICVHFYVSKFEKQLFGNKVVFSLQ